MVTDIKTKIFLFCLVLFSKELFSLARFPQLSTPGVQLHIEDCQAGVQRSSRQKKLLKMQNEPNFTMHPSNLSAVLIETYNERTRLIINANFIHNKDLQFKTRFSAKNNEPNRTQSQPNTNPIRTQFFRISLASQPPFPQLAASLNIGSLLTAKIHLKSRTCPAPTGITSLTIINSPL